MATLTEPAVRSAPVTVRPVASRRDLSRFLRLPWTIYANDPHWVPPLLVDVREFVNRRKHPFYRHGDAVLFLAERGGRAIGRIMASDDLRYNEIRGTNVGCFGMFESIDEPFVAHALLDAAADWLRRRGRSQVLGPIEYSANYTCGLLVDGFNTPPRVLMNHHPPYYAELLESWGLEGVQDMYSWWFVDPLDMVARWRERAERIVARSGITVRPFSKRDFQTDVARCQEIANLALKDNWGSVPLTSAEAEYFARQLARIADPNLVLLAEAGGKPIGFSITIPDVNEAIRPLNGRLTRFGLPFPLLRLVRRMRNVRTARFLAVGVLEEHRCRGVLELLVLRTLDYGKNVLKYTGAELGWTLVDNERINRAIERVGGRRYKTYRVYQKNLV